jgi:hypothetical protein
MKTKIIEWNGKRLPITLIHADFPDKCDCCEAEILPSRDMWVTNHHSVDAPKRGVTLCTKCIKP